jgi:hypothetical protein
MRGSPESGSMMRMSCGGRNTRPNCAIARRKVDDPHGAAMPSVSTVETMAVLRRYSDWKSTMWSSFTSVKPFSSSPLSSGRRSGRRRSVGSTTRPGGGGVDERGGAPVADDRQVKSMIMHRLNPREPVAHVAGSRAGRLQSRGRCGRRKCRCHRIPAARQRRARRSCHRR